MTMEVDGKRPHITAGLGPGECLNGVKRGVGGGEAVCSRLHPVGPERTQSRGAQWQQG